MNPDLQAFVRESLARGIPRATIAERLREAGWQPDEIEPALAAWAEAEFPIPIPRRRPYLSAREAFLYLVLFATLYTTAFNVGALLFQFIDRWRPDPAEPVGAAFSPAAVRAAAAAVLIAYPVFLLLSRHIGRAIAREPDKRGSKTRKWLTYLTLFVAAMVLIGDLSFLVARLLSGDLPARFLLKALAVFAIAGAVFGHYLTDLRREEDRAAAPAGVPRWPARAAGGAVLAMLAAGLVIAGSPVRERLRQLDRRRIDDLRLISSAVESFYSDHRALPGALPALLEQPASRIGAVEDPVTREPYGYRTLDSIRYELCATFATADSLGAPDYEGGHPSHFWRHAAGNACYEFEIPRAILARR